MRRRGCSYFHMGLEKKYKVCNFGLKAEIQWSLKRRGEVRRSLKRRERPAGHWSIPVISSSVFSGRRTSSQKGPRYKRKICANSLWLYSYYTQSSPSKNKNMNYIFINLRVLRCLSSGAICDIHSQLHIWSSCFLRIFLRAVLSNTNIFQINLFEKNRWNLNWTNL